MSEKQQDAAAISDRPSNPEKQPSPAAAPSQLSEALADERRRWREAVRMDREAREGNERGMKTADWEALRAPLEKLMAESAALAGQPAPTAPTAPTEDREALREATLCLLRCLLSIYIAKQRAELLDSLIEEAIPNAFKAAGYEHPESGLRAARSAPKKRRSPPEQKAQMSNETRALGKDEGAPATTPKETPPDLLATALRVVENLWATPCAKDRYASIILAALAQARTEERERNAGIAETWGHAPPNPHGRRAALAAAIREGRPATADHPQSTKEVVVRAVNALRGAAAVPEAGACVPQDLSETEIAGLEVGLSVPSAQFATVNEYARRLIAEVKRRRALSSPSGDARPSNSHEDLELELVRDPGDSHRMLRCKVCRADGPFAIALSDNGQWNLECVNCCETAAILTEVLAKLR